MIATNLMLLILLLGLALANKETVIEETKSGSTIRLTLTSHWDENNKPVMKGKIYMNWKGKIADEWGSGPD